MFKNLLMTLAVVLATVTMTMAQSQGRLKGKITDDTGEPVPFANVIVEKGGTQVGGTSSDFDGNYDINPIPPGTYDLKASCIGYNAFVVKNIVIPGNKITYYDIKMASGSINLEAVTIIDYEVPLISKDNTTSGETMTAEEISKLPNRSAEAVAATAGGVFSADGEVGSIRGAREGAVYYIDGVKVIGNASVPQGAIDQVDVVLGGTPAQYGDAMGGIINMTTKGPSRTWGGGVEVEQSVEGYGATRIGASVNGPLIKSRDEDGKEKESLLGFFLSADYNYRKFGTTSAVGFYRAKDDWQEHLENNPLTLSGLGTGSNVTASYTHKDNLVYSRFLNNTSRRSLNLTAKIDVRTGPNTNLTIGGSMYQGMGHYANGRSNYYFNTDKNYINKSGTYRGYVRFSQRFPSDPESNALISNVYYSIMASYSHVQSEAGDPDLWDNIFAYGNIGKFTTYRAPNFAFSEATINNVAVNGDTTNLMSFNNVWVLDNYYDTLVRFTRDSDFNPLLANYVENYFNLYEPYGAFGYYNNFDYIHLNNGLINGDSPNAAYNLYRVPGSIQAAYGRSSSDQLAFNIDGSMTIGRGDNSHEIKLGLQYEMRNDASISYSSNYWNLMRNAVNFHIMELDMAHPYATSYDGFVDTVMYNHLYDASTQRAFDAHLRKAMGLNVKGTDYILIDTYDFDNNTIQYYDESGKLHTATVEGGLDLGMFEPDELTRDGSLYVDYVGYTYDGHRKYGLFERPSIQNFFEDKDDEGHFLRPIGAEQPIYMAGYIQDKFAFRDLIFNIGIRVDRFDANQDVLKDPYILYDFYTVGDIKAGQDHLVEGSTFEIPENIGDNYAIYVNNIKEKTAVVAYRNGNQWYNESGREVSDPSVFNIGVGGASPWIKDPNQSRVSASSFKDYDPAWSVMPRISFSFPISDEALFFAHYDVLTQRPSGGNYTSPLTYYNFNDVSGTVNNPNLRPEQTIDYELGFKQKLNSTMALTITGYYREIRDMIQMYRFNGAYPKSYNSFGNLDFGTVKGLTASFDMRRTKNARIRASYTLQFASMTGASSTTAAALIAAGVPNLRSTFPTNADQRHGLSLTVDYRFGNGKKYDGPVIRRKDPDKAPIQLLANTGISLTVKGGSGTPYTASRTVSSPISGGNNLLQGTYNGSRKPASFRFDLRLNKEIYFTLGGNKEEGKSGREAFMDVFLVVENILNSKNITGVYAATGNPNDDGYLTAPEWQREINSQIDPQAFIQMYQLYVNSGGNYSTPRQIKVGLSFNF